jgi:glyoxylase-like metal-dependent hydrolase (beta-lactamase superfamily II)
MTLSCLGAARTVTGSKHLLETGAHRVLVDCGLFQGLKALRERNWQPLPLRADSIDVVVLTHAHLDHCGFLPRLVAQGFRGRIFCTPATAELVRIVLADSAKLQEEDADRANRKGYSRHAPAFPLYTVDDANRAMQLLQPVGYERPMPVAPGVQAEFINAGHLLGSAYARVTIQESGQTILFGGDLGRYGRPVLPDPSTIEEADVLLLESTYGDRTHEVDDGGGRLAGIIRVRKEGPMADMSDTEHRDRGPGQRIYSQLPLLTGDQVVEPALMTADTFSLCINTYEGGLTGAWHALPYVQATQQHREGTHGWDRPAVCTRSVSSAASIANHLPSEGTSNAGDSDRHRVGARRDDDPACEGRQRPPAQGVPERVCP